MKTISKKITVYIFVGLLVFCSTSTIYYRSVHAMEWVGGALAFEEALKWLLAAVGIVSAGGMTADYWEQHGDEFVDYCEQQNITNAEVAEWQLKLCEGILDKASACWVAFKDWASSLVASGSGSENSAFLSNGGTFQYDGSSITLQPFNVYYNTYNINGHSFTGYFTSSAPFGGTANNATASNFVLASSVPFDYTSSGNLRMGQVTYQGNTVYYIFPYRSYSFSFSPIIDNFIQNANNISSDISRVMALIAWNAVFNLSDVSSDSDFVSVPDIDIPNIDIISTDIPDEEDPEVKLNMPGLDTSDDAISSDTYDDIIGAINDGTISIDDGIDDIIGRLRVLPYDEVTGDVIPPRPDPDDPTQNIKKDDVVNDNKNNIGFTLAGLENVFPFCIPWDIYAFISILEADPVAPRFSFPFYNPSTKQYVDYEIDLSPWNDVASVIRYGADFTFIIGLALATRRLIGAGGGN